MKITDKNLFSLLSLAEKAEKPGCSGDYEGYIKSITLFGKTILRVADNPIVEQFGIEIMPMANRILYAAIKIASERIKESCIHVKESCEYLKAKNPKKRPNL